VEPHHLPSTQQSHSTDDKKTLEQLGKPFLHHVIPDLKLVILNPSKLFLHVLPQKPSQEANRDVSRQVLKFLYSYATSQPEKN
jgi:hypothetical protein